MADMQIQTTSSKTLVENHNDTLAATLEPNSAPAPVLTRLGVATLSESYQLVKQRQKKYNELSARNNETMLDTSKLKNDNQGEWQEVCSSKNKLKRKKKLSASLTSVTDTVNQEKRTRIEGIQLNCRGKLQINQVLSAPETPTHNCIGAMPKSTEKLTTKPPLPPTLNVTKTTQNVNAGGTTVTTPPPRLKRKLQENVQTIQKLNALTEQLRLEINELKSSLTTERGAVRVLRAQNESETRKWKNEVKKLQNALDVSKKSTTLAPINIKKNIDAANAENLLGSATGSLANYEVQRLTNEIITLKEANKSLEEKKLINCDADRRKAADMRTLKDSYEIRLTQLTKSAKTEISRLLEELKTKERNIGHLKKELQVLQTKPLNETKSKNFTTKTPTNKTKLIKPKKNNLNKSKQNNETKPKKNDEAKDANKAESSNEVSTSLHQKRLNFPISLFYDQEQ
ncbi:nucleoporin nup211-like isoform X2 [Teleopsis dalmanni]|uniref:nucleoporin nup211-like isoform X2 n=1 Tax=Teleopsis dalmanni TaxID=139649 RepID=UPI0018CF4324|nr:nucleoporin nup211-like isoform X2 [Teleopsis dalmanni]